MDYRANLLTVAKAYGHATNRSLARVSTLVRNDGKFFDRIEKGAGCTMATYGLCMRWFSKNWPAGAEWPEGVDRPTADEGAEEDVETHQAGEAA